MTEVLGLVKLAEAAKSAGVSTDLRRLVVRDGYLPSHVRSRAAHVYFPPDDVPASAAVSSATVRGYERSLTSADSAMRRARLEVEAVENDRALAREDPQLELGDDLAALQSYGTDRRGATRQRLASARTGQLVDKPVLRGIAGPRLDARTQPRAMDLRLAQTRTDQPTRPG